MHDDNVTFEIKILEEIFDDFLDDEKLSGFDDKIELNRKLNQNLEQITQAIFKSWFVDFEPVKAKEHIRKLGGDSNQIERAAQAVIAGAVNLENIISNSNLANLHKTIKTKLETKSGCQTKEQQSKLADTAKHFPDKFVESELGLVPEGWKISTVGDEFVLIMGQSPPGNTYNENKVGIPFFQGRRDFGWRYPTARVYCSKPKKFASIGDTLLSVRAPVGDINIAASNCCIGRGLAAIRHKSNCEMFTYHSIMNLKRQFKNFDSEGTVFGSISQKTLKTLKVVKPSISMVKNFTARLISSEKQIHNLEKQSHSLKKIRTILLPKLISGEITLEKD